MSLLPLVSKIIEKVIHNQTQSFLEKNNIIYRYQSGFTNFVSIELCRYYINNKIATGFESGLILSDLQKAFDTVNHDILIKNNKNRTTMEIRLSQLFFILSYPKLSVHFKTLFSLIFLKKPLEFSRLCIVFGEIYLPTYIPIKQNW